MSISNNTSHAIYGTYTLSILHSPQRQVPEDTSGIGREWIVIVDNAVIWGRHDERTSMSPSASWLQLLASFEWRARVRMLARSVLIAYTHGRTVECWSSFMVMSTTMLNVISFDAELAGKIPIYMLAS
jgi:hypothetical protein